MNDKTHLQRRYTGWHESHRLWDGQLQEIEQFEVCVHAPSKFNYPIGNQRLGAVVERFVFHELETHSNVQLLDVNIQINDDNRTIGELDCLFKIHEQFYHLEIVFKFYLFDPNHGEKQIDHWIGPNRKDSLVHKLSKLREHQLPLLHSPVTRSVLEEQFDQATFKQCVNFKAQLFIPYDGVTPTFDTINEACVSGYYIRTQQLDNFKKCKFYIPEKLDWLAQPHTSVDWIPHAQFALKVDELHSQQRSPLYWCKYPNGEIEKFFIVWW